MARGDGVAWIRSGIGFSCDVDWEVWSLGIGVDFDQECAYLALGPVVLSVGVKWDHNPRWWSAARDEGGNGR